MKLALLLLLILLPSCAATRALVRDCQDLQGNDYKNCEIVRKL